MLGYLGYIKISDGQHSVNIQGASEITIRHRGGKTTKVLIGDFKTKAPRNPNYHTTTFLLGHETKRRGKLIERLQYGKGYKDATLEIPYSEKTWQSINGTIKRRTAQGIIHTTFKRGRFIRQAMYKQDGSRVFKFKRGDTQITTPETQITGISIDYKDYNTKELLCLGYSVLKKNMQDEFIFGKDYSFIETYKGRVKNKGSYAKGQRTGAWIINYKEQAYYKGLMVDKDFLTIDPASIKVSRVLKETNAQVRAMYIAKIGMERLCRELKVKVINEEKDKAGLPMRLLELPIKCDDGNGNENGSHARVLQVKCPSTNNDYFLSVPDFVWQNGDKAPVDTCTKAKLWGFQQDTSALDEEIEFIKET